MIELATVNRVDHFNLVIDNLHYAHTHGADRPEIADWTWPE